MKTIFSFLIIAAAIILLYLAGKSNAFMRRVYIITTVVMTGAYLIWRLVFTLSFDSPASAIFSIIFFATELFGALFAVFLALLFLHKNKPKAYDAERASYTPSVDIFISTYNEPVKLVMTSALAALDLSYENKMVYICDDGHRSELKIAAERFGIGYIAREDHSHAKAGNINYALSVTDGELFLLLDADFIVKQRIIIEALPLFKDKNVAMVQYPQSFYNKDPFQKLNKRFFNEQDFFMRYIEPSLARHNALLHVGTNAILRRSAVEAVGGVPLKSITEDMTTGMLLQNAGYKTIFINKAYALGFAPLNLADLKSQRQRWAKGTLQTFRHYNPLKLSGLNKMQKSIYLEMLLYWFTSFQKLAFILLPVLYLFFGVRVINVSPQQMLLVMLPALLLFSLNFRILVGKVRTFVSSHIYDTLMAPYHSAAIFSELFRSETKFNVTPKDASKQQKASLRPVIPHIILTAVLVAAMAAGIWQMLLTGYIWGIFVGLVWTAFNIYALIYCLAAGKKQGAETAGDALSVDVNIDITYNGRTYKALTMSFDGFMVAKPQNSENIFEVGKSYILNSPSAGQSYEATYLGERNNALEFTNNNVTDEQARQMNQYYVTMLHAAKVLDFDMEPAPQTIYK